VVLVMPFGVSHRIPLLAKNVFLAAPVTPYMHPDTFSVSN
jgi:hypothetical protein